jgi:hypothetical protein
MGRKIFAAHFISQGIQALDEYDAGGIHKQVGGLSSVFFSPSWIY